MSKGDNVQAETLAEIAVNIDKAGTLIARAKTFSTGSRGYHASGKLVLNGKTYQTNIQLVEVGSKPQ